jgi:S-adenosylmethionine/arginine decarboxylase-like enzyme
MYQWFSIVSFFKKAYTVSSLYTSFNHIKNCIENIPSNKEENFKGTHIFADFKGLIGDETIIGNFIFDLMQEAIINASTMKIVHKNLVILNKDTQGIETPPGFTSILSLLQLDSSHMTCTYFTSHSYTEEKEMGLLCVDVFTCMSNDTPKVMEYFEAKLKEKYPKVERVSIETHKRFRY